MSVRTRHRARITKWARWVAEGSPIDRLPEGVTSVSSGRGWVAEDEQTKDVHAFAGDPDAAEAWGRLMESAGDISQVVRPITVAFTIPLMPATVALSRSCGDRSWLAWLTALHARCTRRGLAAGSLRVSFGRVER
jgi:hypothetical protein